MKLLNSILNNIFIKLFGLFLILIFLIYIVFSIINFSGNTLQKISEGFSSGKVVDEFQSYITQIQGSNRLQVASVNSIDVFSKKDSKSILWDLISLPDVVVEIKAPVEYMYFIDLNGKWNFFWNEKDTSIIIIAPQIKAGTPALDVSKMEIIVKQGSFLRNVEEIKNNLRLELSDKLKFTANEKISVIRETARTEIKNFLLNWFIKYYFKDSKLIPKNIFVYFPGETVPSRLLEFNNLEKINNAN